MKNRSEEILEKVRKIEISTRKVVDTMLTGQYHTRFKGQGMHFSDFREYFPGDDIRHIDWKVTARTQHAHIKKFEEERDLTIYLLVDVSASAFFGSNNKTKIDALSEICALIAFAAVKNNDRVGLILFSDEVLKHIPPKKGQSHAMRLLAELLHQEPREGKTNIARALEFFANVSKHSSIMFIASDFYDTGYEKQLRRVSRKHDAIGVRITDSVEKKIPPVGWMDLVDAETGDAFWVNTKSYIFQNGYAKEKEKFEKELKYNLARSRMDLLDLNVDEDYFSKVVAFFQLRNKARR